MAIIHTYSGKQVDIQQPTPESIDIADISHALSFLCRGGGHTKIFFPVARHCVYCAEEARARGYSDEVVLACLLHDASEAYMVDLPKPIKDALLPQYRMYDTRLLDCIYEKFLGRGLTAEEAQQVEEVDHDLLKYDLKYLLSMDVELPEIKIRLNYQYEDMERSKDAYMDMFQTLSSKLRK